MPLRPETAPTGGFLPNRDLSTPVPEDEGLSTAAKVTGAAGLGAGMLFAPALTLGAMATVGGGALLADGEGASAAFRMENTVGSLLSSNSLAFDGPAEEGYDPWADIAGTPYEEHWENFTRARSKAHADAIKSDIDREVKDRKYLESQGAVGFAQGLAAGLFDPTILLPGGAVVRSARGGASVLRSAASVAAYGAAGATLTEGALQATQQTRTGEESAMAIAGATVLSGLLGAGLARRALASGFDMDGVGKAIEDDLGRGPDDSAASPAFTPRPDDLSPAGAAALDGSVPAGELRDPDLGQSLALTGDDVAAIAEWTAGANGWDAAKIAPILRDKGVPLAAETTYYRGITSGDPVEGHYDAFSTSDLEGGRGFAMARNNGLMEDIMVGDNPAGALPVARIVAPAGTRVLDLDALGVGTRPNELETILGNGRLIRTEAPVERIKHGSLHYDITTYRFEPDEPVRTGAAPARDPDLDADIATATDTTDALRTELETVASRILPDSVKLNVVESLRADADKVKSGAEQLGIRAYHGTGADFDRFDMAHVGEGEGTRRAGYGLYFADNAANATRYREFTAPTVIGDEVVATGEVRQAAMLRREGKLDQVLGQERRDVQALLDKPNPSDFMVEATNRKLGRVEAMERVAKGEVRSGGHLYEVELDAEPTQLLDWDVPVKDQPEVAAKAREAARKAGLGEEAMDLKGSDFYAALEAKTMSDVATSRLLAESGVPGVRYWNAETTDYVAFDDSLVKITAKDGKPVAAGERAKVVDELFSIRRGVHGTDRGFKTFDESKFAPSEWGHGVYMFPEEWVKAQGAAGKTVGYGHGSGAMRNLILQVETSRPFVIDATEFGKSSADWAALKEHGWTFEGSPGEYWDRGVVGRDAQIRAAKRFSEALLKAGYDSVIVRRDGVDREIVGIRQGSVKYANSGETAFAVRRGEQPQTPDTPRTPTEVKGYHGTPNGAIERFRAEHASEAHDGAFFFTSRPEGTARYTGEAFFDSPFDMNMKPAVYPVYVETKGFKEIDWAGQTHNDGTGPSGGSLNDEMAIAKREGAPGLVVRNIDEGNGEENWYISWGDNTVRSALSESQMLGMRKGTGGDPTVEGSFSRDAQGNLMVTISRAALDPVGTLHHESVHALRQVGVFTPREWKALENAARNKGWMTVPEMADYARLYDAAKGDPRLTEEAIAMAYQRWVRGTEPHKGVIGAAFARVRNFLDAVRNALTGRGMNSAEDIFARIDAGKIAERADGRKRAAMAKAPRQGASSVGAAASQTGDYRLKSTGIGLEKGLARLAPGLWLQNASSRIARQVADELQESGVYRADHADWFETARGGAEQGQYGAVESRIKTFQGQMLADGFTAIDDAFMKYRKGTDKRRTGDLTVTSLSDYFTGSGDKLDFKQFREAVGRAMAEGDSHEIAEVAALAKRLRPHFDKWKDEAIKLGLLPEGVSPETAPSYMMRMYDRKKIIDNRPEFKKVIVNWLGEVEKSNARVRDALRASMDELTSVEGEIAAAETRIQKRAERQAKADKKAREEGRVSTTDEAAVLKDEADQLAIQTAKVRLKEIEKLVQEQVEAYQGKAAGEAQSAIEARRKADEARDPSAKRRPEQMLKPVRDAAEKIAGQEPKDPAELPGLADQIISRIIGTPEGRLPYDAPSVKQQAFGADMDARGPLAARSWLIPDKLIEPFLERDIDMLLRSYAHTMISDIELAKRFGTPDMITKFKEIDEDYSALLNAAKTDGERRKLQREKDETFRNVAAIRDRLRGTYALPEDPDAIMVRTARTALTLSFLSKLGGMTVSALSDPARFVMVNGLAKTFSDGLVPLFTNFAQTRKAMREMEKLHGAAEMIVDSRALRLADVSDTWGQNSRFERIVQSGGRNFGMVSLMAPWNATMKQFASVLTLNRVMRNAVKRAEGKTLSKGEQQYLAFLGLSEGVTRRIGVEFKQHGVKKNGLWLPNTDNWAPDARNAVDALSVALRKSVDTTIVTPSAGEKPKFASTLWGALLLQFKSFAFSATQRMLIAGLQQRDAAAVNGALLSIVLGGIVYILKGEMAGKPAILPKSIDDPNWGLFIGEAVDRSGLLGVLAEANNITEKVTRGTIGLSALTGKPISRYASRNTLQSVAGPVFGMAEDALAITGSAFDDRPWTRKDTHRVRQILPYQNLFYLRSVIDKLEAGVNDAFGVPERASAR